MTTLENTELRSLTAVANGDSGAEPVPPLSSSIALAHDALTQRGGAERVVLSLARIFSGAPIYTPLFHPGRTYPEFSHSRVITSPLQQVWPLRRHHRLALPLLPRAWEQMRVEEPLVICSTSGWAHGIAAAGRKVAYVHNTARWLYQPAEYHGTSRIRAWTAKAMGRHLRRWDARSADSLDVVVANSRNVQARIRKFWRRDAAVVYPPVSIDPAAPREPVDGLDAGFLLTVSRLMPYKNVDAVIEAAKRLHDRQLVVVGSGPELPRLRRQANGTAVFLPRVSDAQLRWLYANSSLYITAAYEDLGLAPVEASVFGTPVVALGAGGHLETVKAGATGLFFDRPEPELIADAVALASSHRWDHQAIAAHGAGFGEARFRRQLLAAFGVS